MDFTVFTLSSSTFLSSPLRPKTHLNLNINKRAAQLPFRARVSFPQCDPSLPPAVQTFWQWLRDEGVVSSKTTVKPALVPEGMGLVAHRDIARNEVVLEVPKRLWINPDAVSASDIGNVCSGLKPWVCVALFLLREKSRDDSNWRLYLDILPQTTNSTVFWWDVVGFPFCALFNCYLSVIGFL
jgi:[ribulose-bisphosphate carboxylase]-lysine N-methyltransferase